MKYLVTISSKAEKAVKKMPMMEKARFKLLIEKLEAYGPIRKELRNFSDLGKREVSLSPFLQLGGVLAMGKRHYRNRGLLCR